MGLRLAVVWQNVVYVPGMYSMIWPRFELLEGPIVVDAVSGSVTWSIMLLRCRARGRSRLQLWWGVCRVQRN